MLKMLTAITLATLFHSQFIFAQMRKDTTTPTCDELLTHSYTQVLTDPFEYIKSIKSVTDTVIEANATNYHIQDPWLRPGISFIVSKDLSEHDRLLAKQSYLLGPEEEASIETGQIRLHLANGKLLASQVIYGERYAIDFYQNWKKHWQSIFDQMTDADRESQILSYEYVHTHPHTARIEMNKTGHFHTLSLMSSDDILWLIELQESSKKQRMESLATKGWYPQVRSTVLIVSPHTIPFKMTYQHKE